MSNAAVEITRPQDLQRVDSAPLSTMEIISQAVARGTDMAVIDKLMDMHERWEKNQARKAFDAAMAAAKAEIPVIFKNKVVDFTSQRGRTHYRHEDMAEIARTVDPILARHGLSYRYRTETTQAHVKVTCVLSHRDGHSEETDLIAGHDNSGNKNSIQAIGSTITFLQRYTLKAALGLAASADDDGKAAAEATSETITDEQAEELRRTIDAKVADIGRFCRYFKIEALPDLPAARFDEAMRMLQQKEAAQ